MEGLENRQLMAVDLTAGDIAFTGLQTDAPDSVSFVLLKAVDNTTSLTFTDNGWATAQNGFANTTENTITVTFNSNFAAGTHFAIVDGGTPQFRLAGTATSAGTVAGGSLSGLSASGDSVLAYQGAAPTTGSAANWVAGISSNTWGSSSGSNFSALPSALISGTHVVTFAGGATDFDNQGLSLANVAGDAAAIRAAVNDPANWTRNQTSLTLVPPATTFTFTSGSAPEINIQGNSIDILTGDTSPNVTDHTDFGAALVGGAAITRTFTIQNTGTAALDLTGSPLVAISGSSDFTVSTQPAVDPIAAAGSTTFVVTFTPSTLGLQTATISIANDDATGGENPYTFNVAGLVNAVAVPEINLQGNSTDIVDGDTTPDVADDTAFGSAVAGSTAITRTFTIQNTGTGPLDLTGAPLVAISGSSDFTISTQPATDPIAAAGSTTFVVTFTPATVGLQTASISIASDDSDENPYNFDVNGTVTAASPEVNVQGNLVSIPDGDITPSSADHTVFTLTAAGSTSTRTFTIQNTGSGNLNLTGGSFASSNALFTLANIPAGPIASGGSATFDVVFSPVTVGTFTSTIQFGSDDVDEATYDFVVRGDATNVSTLVAGDIAFSAFQADGVGGANGDFFEFVALKDLPAGTSIYFTDSGYRTDLNAFRTNENMVRWVAQSTVTAGTKVSFVSPDTGAPASTAEWTGFNPATGISTALVPFGLSTSGDQITALVNPVFGGTDALTGTAIAGVHFGATTYPATNTGTDNGVTALPPGLTDGTTAVSVGNFDNGRYDPSVGGSIESGSASAVRTSLNTDTNWEVSESTLGTGGTTATFAILTTPEINITGNSVTIVDGDATPSLADDTDFGTAVVGSTAISRTFTIENLGAVSLDLTGTPLVAISGSADFTVTTQPAVDPIAPAGSTTFVVTFTPTTLGTQTATLTIANDDSDENPYNFDISGIVTAVTSPEANVIGNLISIVDGDVTPSATDHTDFGNVTVGGTLSRSFTIENTGTGNLTLGAFTSSNAAFEVFGPSGPILPGQSATFDVDFTASTVGVQTATISFVNNDSDENPYNFDVSGNAVAAPANFYINEIMFNPSGTDAPNEFIEIRGTAGATLPAGTYFVGVEGDSSSTVGRVQTIFDLSGLTLGSNGYLVLRQFNNTYSVDPNATVVTATGTGWTGAPGFLAETGSDIENASASYFLITAPAAPVLTDDIDSDNDSIADGAVFTSWTVLDSIGVVDSTTDTSYAAITFAINGLGNFVSGSTVVNSGANTANYFGRIGDSTGSAASDWVGGGLTALVTPAVWAFNRAETFPATLAGARIDDLGSTNTFTPAGVTIVQSSGTTDVTEGGATDTYTIVLNTQPVGNVAVIVDPDTQLDLGAGQGNPITLNFTNANWNTPQTVTVTAFDDVAVEGAHTGAIAHSITTATLDYALLSIASVTANITDNDTVDVPEVGVLGNSVIIVDGDTTPTATDHTSFPATTIGNSSTRTFTIENTGAGSLVLGAFSSTNGVFTIVGAPAGPIVSGGSATFDVVFTPTAAGLQTATISFVNDDADENPYDFVVDGTGAAAATPEADVLGNTISIADGDVTPATADHTDFGSVRINATFTRTFTIQNTGSANLTLGSFTSSNGLFTIANAPSGPIAPAGSATFDVVFAPTAAGAQTSTISFVNNDGDENPYNFDVAGFGFELFINEIMFNPDGADAPNEYLEFRGTPGAILPSGTYFVGIEGDPGTPNPGDVNNLFNLSGLTIGSNGYLVLRQGGSTYSVDPNATTVTGSGLGWTGVAGYAADGTATDIENASASYFLISTPLTLVATDDIDTDNNSIADGPVFSSWTVLDSIGVVDSATDTSYAAITFAINGIGNVPSGSTVVNSAGNAVNYFGRIGNSTGSAATDWVGGGLTALVSPATWAFNRAQTFPVSLEGARIDDIGSTNTFTPSGVTITQSGTTDVTEGGATDTYTVVLNTQPIGNVTVTVTPDAQIDLGAGAGVAVNLAFTNVNWATPQTVTVTAFDDATAEGSHSGTITHAVNVANGTLDYVGTSIASVTANITDNDALANPTISITSGNVVYSNSVYVATASVTGFNSPDPTSTLSFEFYSDAGGTTVISAPENVGTYYVRASTTANAGNNAAQSAIATFDITPFALTASGTAANKVYDATTAASVTVSLGGVFGGDTVTGSASGTFADKNVGVGKTVTIGSVSLTGADAGNYTVGSAGTATADITAKAITGSITAANKVFDGNTSATIVTRTLTGAELGDDVSYVGGTATFASSAVGTGIAVTGTGLGLSGADAGNYSVNTTANTTADITAPPATISEAYLFYNNSGFESAAGLNTPAGVAAAIDPINDGANSDGKDLLRSSGSNQATTFTNVSNYSRGINGLVFDVDNLGSASLSASDFVFRRPAGVLPTGLANPSTWTGVVPTPTAINVSTLSGTVSRVRIEWSDNAIQNTWLQVILKANTNTGLTAPVVYYVGHARGEVNGAAAYRVTSGDTSQITPAISNNLVSFRDNRDYNKDRRVTAADKSQVQALISNTVILNNITIPASGSAEEGAPAPGSELGSEFAAPSFTSSGSKLGSVVDLALSTPIVSKTTAVALPASSHASTDAAVAELFTSDSSSFEELDQSVPSLEDFFATLGKRKA